MLVLEILKQNIKEYGIITLGVILVAVALEYFFIPNNLAAGGVSGLAVVISHYFPSLTETIDSFAKCILNQ